MIWAAPMCKVWITSDLNIVPLEIWIRLLTASSFYQISPLARLLLCLHCLTATSIRIFRANLLSVCLPPLVYNSPFVFVHRAFFSPGCQLLPFPIARAEQKPSFSQADISKFFTRHIDTKTWYKAENNKQQTNNKEHIIQSNKQPKLIFKQNRSQIWWAGWSAQIM